MGGIDGSSLLRGAKSFGGVGGGLSSDGGTAGSARRWEPTAFSLCMLSSLLFASPSSSTTGNVAPGTPFALSAEGLRIAAKVLSRVESSDDLSLLVLVPGNSALLMTISVDVRESCLLMVRDPSRCSLGWASRSASSTVVVRLVMKLTKRSP